MKIGTIRKLLANIRLQNTIFIDIRGIVVFFIFESFWTSSDILHISTQTRHETPVKHQLYPNNTGEETLSPLDQKVMLWTDPLGQSK